VGLGVSLFLIAVGAILRWAITASVSGVNLDVVGLILIIIGVIGLVLSVIFWASLGRWLPGRRSTVVSDRDYDEYRDDYRDRAA
jgi:hypothetical protein